MTVDNHVHGIAVLSARILSIELERLLQELSLIYNTVIVQAYTYT
ncbi:hypothetical protein Hbut_1409 [Hyperthermus butylicus DSM 5456]|uniref:Uncharacterized protein n=1 Tax=Hyperthermus butylicus (strain DSM 5456 / JCM 9403 / PLM1-5) TaxID=415426 RepID=A2BMM2_HYPBU|nr:hypothetical protein Hbut_1409 [Hyperthermus butylicus DSM 5456]